MAVRFCNRRCCYGVGWLVTWAGPSNFASAGPMAPADPASHCPFPFRSLPFSPFPYLPPFPYLSSPPVTSLPLPSLPSLTLEVGPLNPARGSGAEPQPKSNLVHFIIKIWHLVETILMMFLRINSPNSVLQQSAAGARGQVEARGPWHSAIVPCTHQRRACTWVHFGEQLARSTSRLTQGFASSNASFR